MIRSGKKFAGRGNKKYSGRRVPTISVHNTVLDDVICITCAKPMPTKVFNAEESLNTFTLENCSLMILYTL